MYHLTVLESGSQNQCLGRVPSSGQFRKNLSHLCPASGGLPEVSGHSYKAWHYSWYLPPCSHGALIVISSHSSSVQACLDHNFLFYKDTSHNGLGPTPNDLIFSWLFLQRSYFQICTILRAWGLRLTYSLLETIQSITAFFILNDGIRQLGINFGSNVNDSNFSANDDN